MPKSQVRAWKLYDVGTPPEFVANQLSATLNGVALAGEVAVSEPGFDSVTIAEFDVFHSLKSSPSRPPSGSANVPYSRTELSPIVAPVQLLDTEFFRPVGIDGGRL